MAHGDCLCHVCLRYRATSDASRIFPACRRDAHPGDPRPMRLGPAQGAGRGAGRADALVTARALAAWVGP